MNTTHKSLSTLLLLIGAGLTLAPSPVETNRFAQPHVTIGTHSVAASAAEAVDFTRDILPLLSDTCFPCHGPDAGSREADLRLDQRDGLLGDSDRPGAVVPFSPEESELFFRIASDDEYERMPPPDALRQLAPDQIELIRRWIEEGATWNEHWSYRPVVKPTPPRQTSASNSEDSNNSPRHEWVRNPIDGFVLAGLKTQGLQPNEEARKEVLLRRVSLDLTGIPPTLAEIDAFIDDESPQAYQQVVDRLLSSPRYGEKMAWDWLEAARYADSNGYQGDQDRSMWPWRDWLVGALNQSVAYDEFTVAQIAGDLLDAPTHDDRLATGFCRNHMINGEGGRIAEENRVEYIFDQLETVGTVWLGLTYQCCRCHDHKYDALSQQNYYELFGIFNQTPINGAGGNPRTPPNLSSPTELQRRELHLLDAQLASIDQRLLGRRRQLEADLDRWFTEMRDLLGGNRSTATPTTATAESQQLQILEDGSILATGDVPDQDNYVVTFTSIPSGTTGFWLEALQHESFPGSGVSRAESGNFVLTDLSCEVLNEDGSTVPVVIASAEATFEQQGLPVAAAFDESQETGWAVWNGKPVERSHVALFRFADSPQVIDTQRFQFTLKHESQHAKHILGRFRISFATEAEPSLDPGYGRIVHLLDKQFEDFSDTERAELLDARTDLDDSFAATTRERSSIEQQRKQIQEQVPVVMVMQDQGEYRTTHVLKTGLYNQPEQEVLPKLPHVGEWQREAIGDQSSGSESARSGLPNRLDLAEWLVDAENPLTPRVTVNRIWQSLFGVGIVATSEDFGTQGDRPQHPELLDWLAAELVESDWDVKHIQRLIVTSATYRQSAQMDATKAELDPENRWLSRGPRRRMPSWMIRDAALAQSGLLVEKIGGPPVKPYQPSGVWAEATFGNRRYQQGSGEDLYRRSLYTFWRRIVGPTMFFDVSKRQTCSVKPSLTNTPLHALVTLNETTFIESARVLAQELSLEFTKREDSIAAAFRLCTSRAPTPHEQQLLIERYERFLEYYHANREQASQLILVGESPSRSDTSQAELAALTNICLLIINLDESLCK